LKKERVWSVERKGRKRVGKKVIGAAQEKKIKNREGLGNLSKRRKERGERKKGNLLKTLGKG